MNTSKFTVYGIQGVLSSLYEIQNENISFSIYVGFTMFSVYMQIYW